MKRISAALGIWLASAALAAGGAHSTGLPIGRALADVGKRLAESPRDAGLLNDYGNLLVHAGYLDEAEEAYRSALEIAPESTSALYNLGLLQLELGRPRAARRNFRRAIKIDPSFGRAHYGLGATFEALERDRRAVAQYSKALRLDPQLLDARRNPEILFNRLTTWASMHAYLSTAPGRGGRVYADPRPIVGLLVPGIEELLDRDNGDTPAQAPEEPQPEDDPAPEQAASQDAGGQPADGID